MTLLAAATTLFERMPLPDAVSRAGVDFLVGRTSRRLASPDPAAVSAFARAMARRPIAEHVEAANAQHYEVPAEFFELVLGPQRKYSSCLYDESGLRDDSGASLAAAEERALSETAAHADLADGQRILELGCGWGSLSLWMARRYPAARIVAVSNSQSQRRFIETKAAAEGLSNLSVVTADMNAFAPPQVFDRIVSVEMFEHIANWRALLARARGWLAPDGRLFIHVFSHRHSPYAFDHADKADWIAQHFFTGGVMPSHDLIREFPDLFTVEADWRWDGVHYARTLLDWLVNFDRNEDAIAPILRATYGADARLWKRRWRLFFLASAGLFGHRDGREWAVSHYRLRPA
jgi:cyclopropane-fatty-acyl-phospholipid synthase